MNSPRPSVQQTDVLIIGAGFAGLGLAVALKREGIHDFTVVDRADDVGGTWRDNTYPGAACDIESHLYSYSFRPNPDWSRVYANQPEILEYLRDTASDEGIYPHIRFGATVEAAHWSEDDMQWFVQTTSGTFRSKVLVSAAGHLSDPSYPDIQGLDSFEGHIFHSARWNHDAELSGKRVGVIGTGASAIQIVPELQRTVAGLTVFQRSAPYIVPRRDHVYSEAEKRLFALVPQTAAELRDSLFWNNESRFPQRLRVPTFVSDIRQRALDHLAEQVSDEDLRARLAPTYEIGCKRILISNDYYPALTRPNVNLETRPIARATETGIELADGECIDLDALIVATGFEAADLPIAGVIRGRDDRLLADAWAQGGQAFACTAVSGFPNMFVMLGPNTGLGAGSIIFMVETQINYIREALGHIAAEGVVVEPMADAQRDYVESIYARSEQTVWVQGGCSSWYLHESTGKLTTLWPDFMSQFRRDNGSFSVDGYEVLPARELDLAAAVDAVGAL